MEAKLAEEPGLRRPDLTASSWANEPGFDEDRTLGLRLAKTLDWHDVGTSWSTPLFLSVHPDPGLRPAQQRDADKSAHMKFVVADGPDLSLVFLAVLGVNHGSAHPVVAVGGSCASKSCPECAGFCWRRSTSRRRRSAYGPGAPGSRGQRACRSPGRSQPGHRVFRHCRPASGQRHSGVFERVAAPGRRRVELPQPKPEPERTGISFESFPKCLPLCGL